MITRKKKKQAAISVRFFKKQRIAMWRVFNEMDETVLENVFEQIGYFNRSNSIITCILDFSSANISLDEQTGESAATKTNDRNAYESIEYIQVFASAKQQDMLNRWFAKRCGDKTIVLSDIV